MPQDPLALLARMHEEQKNRIFPRNHLPDKFRDLYAQWVEYDGFVAGLATSVLSGGPASVQDVGPFKSKEFRPLLQQMRKEFPGLADRYFAEFDFLDGMLALIKRIVKERTRHAAYRPSGRR